MGVPTHRVVLLRNLFANQKAAIKAEFWKDGIVRHRESCATGLHPVSFVIQHIRSENNEGSFGQIGRKEDSA